jgi:predicted GNAT family acetyltransferase
MEGSCTVSDVNDNTSESRFEVAHDGFTGDLTYSLEGDTITLIHTGVPEEMSGHGYAGQLVQAAVDRARRDKLTIIPVCPYARRWLRKNVDDLGDVAIDWSQEPLS